MRRFRIRIGRVLGVPLAVHASWFVIYVFAVWALAAEFGAVFPLLPLPERATMAVVTGLAFFACLTVHELAHAVVARRFGVNVTSITLFLLGGVAEIVGELPTPGAEFAVALAGPGTSIALGSALALCSVWMHRLGWAGPEAVTFTLALVNLGVALFNLIPGLPLDGGRLLRAAVWRRTGSFARGTRVAAVGGRLVAGGLICLGVVGALLGRPETLWYVPMGSFIWFLAGASTRAAPPPNERALALSREGEAA